jgi:hypothetical protein
LQQPKLAKALEEQRFYMPNSSDPYSLPLPVELRSKFVTHLVFGLDDGIVTVPNVSVDCFDSLVHRKHQHEAAFGGKAKLYPAEPLK